MKNKNRNRTLLIFAIILLFANLTVLTIDWIEKPNYNKYSKKEYSKKGKNGFDEKIAKELNMSNKQIKLYKELKQNHFKEIHSLRDSIRMTKKHIHGELMKAEPDMNTINQLTDSIGLLNAKFEKMNYNHLYELRQQLNPDQQEKFKLLIKKLPYGKEGHRKRYKANIQE